MLWKLQIEKERERERENLMNALSATFADCVQVNLFSFARAPRVYSRYEVLVAVVVLSLRCLA